MLLKVLTLPLQVAISFWLWN